MKRFRNSITSKMILLVLGGTSLVFSLVFWYSYTSSKQAILEASERYARALALSVSRRVDQDFRAVAKVAENLGFFLESAECDENALLRVIRRAVESNNEVFGATAAFEPYALNDTGRRFAPYYFKGAKGIEHKQLDVTGEGYFREDWYYIPKELGAPVWAEPYYDEGGGAILMTTYSVPLFDKTVDGERKLRAVIGCDISLEWLTKLLNSIKVGERGYCFIVSDIGTFIAHPRQSIIAKESIFSIAEEFNDPQLRKAGQAMRKQKVGFVDLGAALSGEEVFLAFARIQSPSWTLGAVFPKQELFAQVENLHYRAVFLGVVGLTLLLAVSVFTAMSFARPLRRMAAAAEKVSVGDLNVDLSDIKSNDEVGRLAEAFSHMVQGLRDRDFIRDTFGQYLTREVVNRLLDHKDGLRLGGEGREISMIMSDLRGFTALTAHMNPEDVITFLNRYLGKMVEILLDYRGIIDEIIGDGILAFFGAPEPMEDHPERAVACALKMQKAMEEINALNEADGFPTLEMGIAVNTGHVVVGNIGSERRKKYGAVGSQVNFTGRVESFTVGGQVLITRATYDKLADKLDVANVLRVEMKGMTGPVELFDVKGIRGTYEVRLTERHDSLVSLEDRIPVRVSRLEEKTVTSREMTAAITHISRTSAKLRVPSAVGKWENLKIVFMADEQENQVKEVYAKTVSVEQVGQEFDAVVRFTSVSPEVNKMLSDLLRLRIT
jgi:sigma-B regulation protein RsbU (phosphoserine phosphatase)